MECYKNDGTYEVNPILGKHPTPERLVGTFAVTTLLHFAVAYILPSDLRTLYYSSTIGIKWAMVEHNQWIDDGKDKGWTVNITGVF